MATEYRANKRGKSGDWECVVVEEPWSEHTNIYLVSAKNGLRTIANINKDGVVEMRAITEGQEHKPLVRLPYYAWQAMLDAMGDIQPDIKKEVVDGELKATKYHLEDLRNMLKLAHQK